MKIIELTCFCIYNCKPHCLPFNFEFTLQPIDLVFVIVLAKTTDEVYMASLTAPTYFENRQQIAMALSDEYHCHI